MKQSLLKLLSLAAVLTTLQANAAMYILANDPLGGWALNNAVQMTDNGDGTFSYTTELSGTVYFVFADGISDDWETFSNNYRYGPTTADQGETVNPGEWVATQKSREEAYIFSGDGAEYTITFDKNNMRVKIVSTPVSSFQSGGIYYNVTGTNTVEVTKGSTYGDDYSGNVTIPSSVTYGGVTYQVTAIGASAFLSCHDLTSVSIPTTVTTIGEGAFYYCTSLTKVIIPESVRTIDAWNFYKSDELTTVVLPSTLYSMGNNCFGSCSKLSKVTCRSTATPELGSSCFSYAYSSKPALYVPEGSVSAYQANSNWSRYFSSITAMPEYDFTNMNLKFVITSASTAKCTGPAIENPSGGWTIPATVYYDGVNYRITEVGRWAFYDCTRITSITLGSNIEVVGAYAFYACTGITVLNLGNVKTISSCAFGDCTSLTSVSIPNTVTTIDEYGFGGCGLTSVTIPASVLSIGTKPFYSCESLTTINVASGNPNYTSSGGVLFNKEKTSLISYPIGKSSTSYSVPEGVTTLQRGAFGYSKKLKSVTLPSTMVSIDGNAFAYCSLLTSLTVLAHTPPTCADNVFVSTIDNSGLTLTVPRDCKSDYQAANVWMDFPTIQEKYYDFYTNGIYYNITGENTVEVTSDNANGGTYSGSVTIPETVRYNSKDYIVTAIGYKAFSYSRGMTTVNIPSTITEIGNLAFYYCSGLTNITLPMGLRTLGNYAFYNCVNLGNVQIPPTVTTLGTYVFSYCESENFTEIVIPHSVTTMNYGVFYGCAHLTKVTIGSGVRYMGDRFFYDCPALAQVISLATAPPSIQSETFLTEHYSNVQLLVPKGSLSAYKSANYWKNFASIAEMGYDFEEDGIFYNILNGGTTVEVTYMTTAYNSYSGVVNIPEKVTHDGVTYTVTSIGSNAFRMSKSLTTVTIPNSVTSIGNYAFYYCEGLTNVFIPNSVRTIANNAFWLCLNLKEAIIPNSVTTIGSMAFRNCTAMTRVIIGENVTSIGSTSFYYNPNITEVICLAATPPTLYDSGSNTTFMSAVYQNAVLRVPYGSHEAYRNDANWGRFTNIVSEEVINPVMAGDVNGDGKLNISDVTLLISMALDGNTSATTNPAADVNGDGTVNITDVTLLIGIVLNGETGGTLGTASVNYLINSVPFTMVKVDGGTFMMGIENVYDPVHQVTLSDYYIGETEVTQALWQVVMGSNPSSNKSDVNLPVENMTWDACLTFATKLSLLTGQNFHLPSEAQWEFAARGGNKSQGYTYAGSNNLNEVAWYEGNSNNTTHVVGTKKANELGLYDMSGNVFEWIQDYWGGYSSMPQIDPTGPLSGEYRVCRSSAFCRPSNSWFMCGGRTYDSPSINSYDSGLRLASSSTGEWAVSISDGTTPLGEGQMVNDHLFVRMDGNPDNQVSITGTQPQLMWLWLDDDQIYTNTQVQALTPMAYNEIGNLYNEITYNALQFNLYLPDNLELVDVNGNPVTSATINTLVPGNRIDAEKFTMNFSRSDESKYIDGVRYKKYIFLLYSISSYGTHFSAPNASAYAQHGAYFKDDAPLLGVYVRNANPADATVQGADIIIANTEFSVSETTSAGWDANTRRFIYGSGGNNTSQRFHKYVRVRVTQ